MTIRSSVEGQILREEGKKKKKRGRFKGLGQFTKLLAVTTLLLSASITHSAWPDNYSCIYDPHA